MLVDLRTYRVKPGIAQAQLDVYEKYGLATQIKYCGEPIAYLSSPRAAISTPWSISGPSRMPATAPSGAPPWPRNRTGTSMCTRTRENGYIVDQRTSLMVPAKFAPIRR